jgi:hypothetical protein
LPPTNITIGVAECNVVLSDLEIRLRVEGFAYVRHPPPHVRSAPQSVHRHNVNRGVLGQTVYPERIPVSIHFIIFHVAPL